MDGTAPVSGNVTLNAVTGSNAGTPAVLELWVGTKAQYDAIASKSTSTVYVVTGAMELIKEAVQNAAHNAAGIGTLEQLADGVAE